MSGEKSCRVDVRTYRPANGLPTRPPSRPCRPAARVAAAAPRARRSRPRGGRRASRPGVARPPGARGMRVPATFGALPNASASEAGRGPRRARRCVVAGARGRRRLLLSGPSRAPRRPGTWPRQVTVPRRCTRLTPRSRTSGSSPTPRAAWCVASPAAGRELQRAVDQREHPAVLGGQAAQEVPVADAVLATCGERLVGRVDLD